MKKILIILIPLIAGGLLLFAIYSLQSDVILGAPASQATRDLIPDNDSVRYIGTTTPSTKAYLAGYFDELCLTADSCKTAWPSGGASAYDAFTHPVVGESATTTILNMAGFNTTASSTVGGNLHVIGDISLPTSGFIGFTGNTAVGTSNYSLFGSGTLTLLNARSGASIGFRIANADVANFTTTGGFGFGATYYNIDPGQNNMTVEGKLGVGTSSPGTLLSLGGDGTGINFVDNGTSTFQRGINSAGLASSAGLSVSGGNVDLPAGSIGASEVALANLTATDSTLTFSGTYTGATARTIGLNLGNANTWTALQLFSSTATTTFAGGIKPQGFEGSYIDLSGQFRLGTGSATSTLSYSSTNGGELDMATSTIKVGLATAEKLLFGVTVPNPATASSTIILGSKPYAFTLTHILGSINAGTNCIVKLTSNTGAVTNSITLTPISTSTVFALTTNTYTRFGSVTLNIVSCSGSVGQLNVNIIGTVTAQ